MSFHDPDDWRTLSELKQAELAAEAQLKAWSMMFEFGHDYFHELRDFGIDNDDAARKAAPSAWRRLGKSYMQSWRPTPSRAMPSAFDEFGEPARSSLSFRPSVRRAPGAGGNAKPHN